MVEKLALITALAAIPVIAGAQSIRGTAVDGTGAPVPGAIVLLLNERDSVTSRALTNETGEFRVAAVAAGAYRLRTMRIGFRPATSPSVTLAAGQELTQQLMLAGVPFSLDTVRVTGRNACRTPSDSAAAVYAIWEQVRTALTATQLTAGIGGIDATLMTYERALDPDRERVLTQESSIRGGLRQALWVSPSADSLRRGGYVVANLDGTTTYWAPDLKVLLSNEFIEDHCLRLADSREASRIGISFEPTRDRRGVPGIRGTLWLDRKSVELRRMEFRYTNATREQEYGSSGGHMEFARTKTGAWVISGWNIRMPVLSQREIRSGGVRSGATTTETRVSQIRVEGGEVVLVTRSGDTVWARPALPLAGTVMDSVSGAWIADARIALRGTAVQATTDSAGRFRIANLLPGQYTVEVRTKTLSALGAVHTHSLTFIDSTTRLAIRVPSAEQFVQSVCPAKDAGVVANRRDGMVAGTVRIPGDTTPPRGVKVVAQWDEATATGRRWGGIDAVTDVRGTFRICGLPLSTTVTVGASTRSGGDARQSLASASPVEVNLGLGTRFASVELVLDPSAARGAEFSGVVLSDVNGQPIADVEVAILEISKNVFTNERGAFRISNVPPGARVVTTRRIGYAVKSDTINFAANETVERSLLLSRVNTLDTVVVAESAVIPEFEENRRLGLGHFLTRADLEKLGGQPIANRLDEVPGVGIISGRSTEGWLLTSRPRLTEGGLWCPDSSEMMAGLRCGCYPKVYLDKALMNPPVLQRFKNLPNGQMIRPTPPFDVNSIPTVMIEAIEWYAGPAQTPMKYSTLGSDCGVLVIHTRRSK